MNEMRKLVCIVCPLGCEMEVKLQVSTIEKITGNGCKKGVDYAAKECSNPVRILTTTVRITGGQFPVVSVKSEKPLPKGCLFACMKRINECTLTAPVKIGEVVVENILGTGVNIVVTGNMEKSLQ